MSELGEDTSYEQRESGVLGRALVPTESWRAQYTRLATKTSRLLAVVRTATARCWSQVHM